VRATGTTSLLVYWVHVDLEYGPWFAKYRQQLTVPEVLMSANVLIACMVGVSIGLHAHAQMLQPKVEPMPGGGTAPAERRGSGAERRVGSRPSHCTFKSVRRWFSSSSRARSYSLARSSASDFNFWNLSVDRVSAFSAACRPHKSSLIFFSNPVGFSSKTLAFRTGHDPAFPLPVQDNDFLSA